jgi:hypothetical protein
LVRSLTVDRAGRTHRQLVQSAGPRVIEQSIWYAMSWAACSHPSASINVMDDRRFAGESNHVEQSSWTNSVDQAVADEHGVGQVVL